MMENDFPGNSHKKKAENAEPGKKVEKVIAGDVVRRKKPLGKRFTETFIGGDAKSAAGYVVFDVLIPAAKDTVADAMSQGVERMLFGEVRSTSRRTGLRPGASGPAGHVAYNRMYSSSRVPVGRPEPRMSRRSRSMHNFDEIILPTRVEADAVLDRLLDLIDQYEIATVRDLYDLVGETAEYTDVQWGWMDLRTAGVTRVRTGYLLDLPRPEPID